MGHTSSFLRGEDEKVAIAYMHEAARMAKQALCTRASCGSVVVKNKIIIGRGFNAPPENNIERGMCEEKRTPGKPGYDSTCCMHAEWRALIDALKHHEDKLSGAKLFFVRVDDAGEIKKSGDPYCTVCSRFALDLGLKSFLLWHEKGIKEYSTEEYNFLSYNYKGAH